MKQNLQVCLVPLLLAPCLYMAGAQGVEHGERLQFANGLYARGLHELALKEYQQFIEAAPGSDTADTVCFRMGECYRKLGRLSEAERMFKRVFTQFPESDFRFRAGFRRADIFLQIKEYDGAIDLFRAVLAEEPPSDMAAACRYALGEALLAKKDTEAAVAVFEEIRTAHPDAAAYSLVLLKLGSLYAGQAAAATGEEADALVRKALDMYAAALAKPGSDRIAAEALFQTAELHFSRDTYDLSAEAYARLLKEHPDDQRAGQARLQATWAAHNAGLYAQALRTADNALKDMGDSASAEWLYLKANCQRQLMKGNEAVATYELLLKQYPAGTYAAAGRYEKALTLYKMGRFEDSIAETAQIRNDEKLRKDVYWLLAECHSALENEADAIQYYRLLARNYPKSDVASDATYRLAHHLQNTGAFLDASRHYSAVAANFPDSELAPQALFASGFCLARAGQHDGATRDWAALVATYPQHALVEEALYRKALSDTRLKRDKAALNGFRELIKGYPATRFLPDAYYWQGLLLMEADQKGDAENAFRLSLKNKPIPELAREARYYLALLLQKREQFDEAAELFQPLLETPVREKFPPALIEWLAQHQYAAGKHAETAVAARELAGTKDAARWQQIGWALAGRAELALGHADRATDAYTRALAVDANTPYAAESALRLGELTLGAGKPEEAEAVFARAANMASDESQLGVRANAYAGLGYTSKALGKTDDAVRYFMSVAVLYDDAELVPRCLYEAVTVLDAAGKTEDAARVAEELKERFPESDLLKKLPGTETQD